MQLSDNEARRVVPRCLSGAGWLAALWFAFVVPIGLAADADGDGARTGDDADPYAWRLDRSRKGIDIFTRSVEGSRFRAVRATMVVDLPIEALVALVRDTEACPSWAHLCKSSRVVEETSETDMLVYTLNDIPWPVSDRDAVARVEWRRDADTGRVVMTATAVPSPVEGPSGAVRLTNAVTEWRFLPLADGRVAVESEAHVDPGGPMPAWLINRMLLDAPYKTLTNMREILSDGRYQGARFDFMTDDVSVP
ncbi:MAG: START domain-containing protein [Pseudomonadota bacterium]